MALHSQHLTKRSTGLYLLWKTHVGKHLLPSPNVGSRWQYIGKATELVWQRHLPAEHAVGERSTISCLLLRAMDLRLL